MEPSLVLHILGMVLIAIAKAMEEKEEVKNKGG